MKHNNPPSLNQTRNAINNAENEALEEYNITRKSNREQQRNLSKLKDQQRQQNKNKRFDWQ